MSLQYCQKIPCLDIYWYHGFYYTNILCNVKCQYDDNTTKLMWWRCRFVLKWHCWWWLLEAFVWLIILLTMKFDILCCYFSYRFKKCVLLYKVETMCLQESIKIPVAILKVGETRQARLDIEFPDAPVTFTLIQVNYFVWINYKLVLCS